MLPNKKAKEAYELHAKNAKGDRQHLGNAENIEEIIKVIENISPRSYTLVASCVDWAPTLKIKAPGLTRRINLSLLSDQEKHRLVEILDEREIPYKPVDFFNINPDFSVPLSTRMQKSISYVIKLYDFCLKMFYGE